MNKQYPKANTDLLQCCMNMGEIVKSKRKERGWSQVELSNITGVPISAIRKFERGNPLAYLGHLVELCAPFNIHPSELWRTANESL